MSSEEKCPNCNARLDAATLHCGYCQITFLKCSGCGRLQPEWVSICTYCNSAVHGGMAAGRKGTRAIEIGGEVARKSPPVEPRPKKPTTFERLRRLDTQARGEIRAAKLQSKAPAARPAIPAPNDEADPSIAARRAHHVTHDFDPKAAEEELHEEERQRMQRWRKSERLNPNWFYKQSAVPTFLVFLGLIWAYGSCRYSARSYGSADLADFIPHILVGAGLLWIALLAIIDRIRPIR
jgi:hypothetical protein